MDGGGGCASPDPGTGDVTTDVLAELQAGLLDDATAARVRRIVRTDPHAAQTLAGLDAVRHHLAELGADPDSAPAVPPAVLARIRAALRDAPRR